MHHCLEIPELVEEIFLYLNAKTLASLARTCKSLREPALDELYCETMNLGDLFGGMRLGISSAGEYQDVNARAHIRPAARQTQDVLEGSMSQKILANVARRYDWRPFLRLSSRVNVLHLISPDFGESSIRTPPIHYGILNAALSYTPGESVLFPSLRHLYIDPSNLNTIVAGSSRTASLAYFLVPTLLDITFEGMVPGGTIRVISQRCPALRSLHLSNSSLSIVPGDGCTLSQLSEAFSRMQTLVSITMQPPSGASYNEWLAAIAHAPCLRTLQIDMGTIQVTVTNQHHRIVFPSLTSLCVSAWTYSAVCQLFDGTYNFSSVTQISLDTLASARNALTSFVGIIAETLSPERVTRISISTQSRIQRGEFPTMDDIRPLFIFSSLTDLRIDSPRAPVMDDTGLEYLSLAFPRLRTFHYSWKPREDDHLLQTITFSGIRTIIANCRELQDVYLIVDARVSHNPPLEYITMVEPHISRVTRLSLEASPIDDVAYTVACIRALFPYLVNFLAQGSDAEAKVIWKEVHSELWCRRERHNQGREPMMASS
ncbi:hypothetical protein CONPUDRAFT_147956 [Coniophora puteana RWD-64-598 SS2]|uniref:F-box domain-containing protein n=1 Tax=Coniophora puteana (strain RWD-64-598) TaxID=741705 RepID=R7SFW9_CONPW|nr:uncharacterized protein CONPUDRAFT_147956 [Coniophora puteana RWD-64-598 SS2]EIW73984.1 hypothetical protein CONPUDRAFT_147956 [Coniophora puteana RWD-64-598 SS2]